MRFLKKKKFNLTEEELNTLAAEIWDKAYEAGWCDYAECYSENTLDPEKPETLTQNPYKEKQKNVCSKE